MESIWKKTAELPEFHTLTKDIRTKVLIIGGGMAGILCAYFCSGQGWITGRTDCPMTICPEERCTGCGACQSACPADCITLALNRAGDRVAVIDESRCTRCGKCSRICPVLHPPVLRESRTALAAYAVEAQVRQSSASGGAAAVLARQVVESGGCAYGAAFTAPTTVKLVRVDAPAQLSRLQGSKYVHAATGSAYRKVQSDLKAGRQVLFTGTPCQVAGLYAYLGSDPPGLTTCDLVCHGVPEADTLNAYLQTELNPAAIARLTFRDGDGWVMKAYDRDGGVLRRMDLKNSLYYNGFMEGYLYRSGCYTCPYATEKRVADLTLGDFWGIGEETPYPNAAAELKKGLSLILVHTDKGQALLNACAPALVTTVRTPAEAVKKNHQLRHPTPDSPAARRFHNLYGKKGAAYAIAHCNEKKRRTLRLRHIIRHCPPLLALCRKIPKLRDKL